MIYNKESKVYQLRFFIHLSYPFDAIELIGSKNRAFSTILDIFLGEQKADVYCKGYQRVGEYPAMML